MRKKKILLISLIAVCMIWLFGLGAQAAGPFRGSVQCKTWNSTGTTAYFDIVNDTNTEVAIYNKNGVFIESKIAKTTTYFSNLKKNTLYYFAARSVTYDYYSGGYVATSEWSNRPSFCAFESKVSLTSKTGKTVAFKCPKIAGIKSMTLYLSANSSSGFKKAKTMSPGNTYKTSKCNGKTFVTNKKYYYKYKMKTTSGEELETPVFYFYIYNR